MRSTHFLLIYSFFIGIRAKEYFLRVTIPHGALDGSLKKTWTGKDFVSFTGIPYAQPPIGSLRFKIKPPLPAESWENVLDATTYKSMCAQDNVLMNVLEVSGSEDCLYINVYTPQIRQDSSDLLPCHVFHTWWWVDGRQRRRCILWTRFPFRRRHCINYLQLQIRSLRVSQHWR
ncbi:esterase SG1-like isoform X2 [Photinus pyralis]|uniref:esterase SG1-like isoform X2 n=1 Tax=Photinus pyralis TaxID=7054 RepID=UPI0012670FEB|nr:esterase SG1-like isoform X2 [Photinus pyralis]